MEQNPAQWPLFSRNNEADRLTANNNAGRSSYHRTVPALCHRIQNRLLPKGLFCKGN